VTKKSEYHDVHEVCRAGWSNFISQAAIDLDYYFRAQHTEEEATRAYEQNRELYTIDKIGRQVNLLQGYEIRNRHVLKIAPLGMHNDQEEKACSQMSKIIMANMKISGGYEVLSEAFKWGTLVEGSNLIEIWRDREGDLQFSRLGWNQFLLDPSMTKSDLSDCKNILIGRWIDEDKAKFLLPGVSDRRIDGIPRQTTSQRWDFLGTPPLANREGKRLYEEWWRRDTEYIKMVISRQTGQQMPFDEFADRFYGGDKRLTKKRIGELRLQGGAPALSVFSQPVDKIRLTIFIDNEEVWSGDNPLKANDYNFVWVHGDYCAEHRRDELKLQSFIRKLRDPQRALNRRTNQIYDLIESQIQGLRMARSKYIANPESVYKSGQGIVIHTKPEMPDEMALNEVFRQFTGAEVPNSLFAALKMTDEAETATGGLNQEIFGSDDKDNVPAILGRFRTGQALTGQAGMFQNFRASKRELGKKLVRLIQLNYSAKKVADIINEYPVPAFYNMTMARYDCTPVEGLETDSQQQMFYLELKALRQEFEDAKAIIPLSELIKYSPTPFKEEFLQMIQRAEQQAKAMQAKAMQEQERQARLTDAVTATQVARTLEDTANAYESRADAQYTRAKTVAEIEKLQNDVLVDIIKEKVKLEMAQMQGANNEQKQKAQPVRR